MVFVGICDIGLVDYLFVFCVCKNCNEVFYFNCYNIKIKNWNMKNFNVEYFIDMFMNVFWDICFVFDDIDVLVRKKG